jgi:photosystem II stability/assembly factor-like uncharacterized protein
MKIISSRMTATALAIVFIMARCAFAQTWMQTSAPVTNWASVATSADGNNVVAVVNGGGIYASSDSGVTWRQGSAPVTNWSLVASSADGNNLIAVAYLGPVYSSTDAGSTWVSNSLPSMDWTGIASSADGSNWVAVAFRGSIYTSTNAGVTWASNNISANLWAVASSVDGTRLSAAAGTFGFRQPIFRSTNSGASWMATGPTDVWQAIASSADGTQLVATAGLGAVYVSHDSGTTWQYSGVGGQAVAASANAIELVAVGTGIFTSSDSGSTWTQNRAPEANWRAVASSADGHKRVAVVGGGGIYISKTGWTQTSAPLTNWTSIASSADGSRLVATANGGFANAGPIFISTNSGATWVQTSAPLTHWSSVASSADGTKLAAVSYANGVFTSADSGANWTPTAGPSGRRIACSGDGTKLLVAGGSLYYSTNFAATWTQLPATGWCIASSADGVKLVSAYFNHNGFPQGCICISTNAGATWTETSAPLYSWTGWTALASSADGIKLAATIGYTSFPTGPGPIYISHDGGGTWQASSSPTSHWNAVACSADGTRLVAATSFAGIYTSTNAGVTWMSNNAPVTQWSAVACSADGTKLVAVVDGGGIWTAQSTPAPLLSIAPAGTNAVLSWIVPSADFMLQENPDLTSTSWTDLIETPILNFTNLQNEVTVPRPAGNHFYRLKH